MEPLGSTHETQKDSGARLLWAHWLTETKRHIWASVALSTRNKLCSLPYTGMSNAREAFLPLFLD